MNQRTPTPTPKARKTPREPPKDEVISRLKRIESRIVQLMKHVGMVSDGRNPLPEEHDH